MAAHEVPIDDVPFARRAKLADHAEPAFFAEATLDEVAQAIADEEGGKPLSRSRMQQIEREALRKLRRILEAKGITSPEDLVP